MKIIMLRLMVLASFLVSAFADCASNMTIDPKNFIRVGSDYKWLDLGEGAVISDCINACCAETECLAFSFNNQSQYCTRAGPNSKICCALKDAVPATEPSHDTGVYTGHKPVPPAGLPKPSSRILEYLDMGFTQFMHFSVTTFGNIEHDCVNGKCLPASEFNPSEMEPDNQGVSATDQWAMTAKAMGAGEICLTAHHEGGFCLWPSRYSNYTVMQSKYQKDIVSQFVASCKKYDIRPCFYIGPNANGYFTQVLKYTPKQFYDAQMGMIKEVLTNYGPISRLWWDHYMQSCGGLSECPACKDPNDPTCFPAAWKNFTQLVRSISNDTLLGTGPDVAHSGGGETGVGDYPVWNAANSTTSNGFGPLGYYFRPREADATIQNPGDAWFWKKGHAYWNASQIWDHYMLTVGRGEAFILNMPPDTTGRIPQIYVDEATKFGNALRDTFDHPIASVMNKSMSCSNPLEIKFDSAQNVDTAMTREDLTQGQRISKYSISLQVGGQWTQVKTWGETVGSKVIDFFDSQKATAARFQCLGSVQDTIYIRSFGVFVSQRPE